MAGPFVVNRNAAVIGAPAQRVFDYVADMARHGEWNPEPDFRVTEHTQVPMGVGSVFRREKNGIMRGPLMMSGGMSDNPLRLVKSMTITAYEPYHTLVFETTHTYNNLVVSADKLSFDLRQETEGTRVTMLSEVEAMVPGGFMGPAYAMRVARGIIERLALGKLAGRSPKLTPGPQLSRIKQMMETGKISGRI